MADFATLQLIPMQADGVEPVSPDLSPYAKLRTEIKLGFRKHLLALSEEEPYIGVFFNVPALGRVIVGIDSVKSTAALVTIALYKEPPEASTLLATAILLCGFKDADDMALDQAAQTPAFRDNPHYPIETYESAREGPRPMMVNCMISQDSFKNPLLRLLSETLADAFFDMFGQSQVDDSADEPGDESAA
jgi:hypothetical protein